MHLRPKRKDPFDMYTLEHWQGKKKGIRAALILMKDALNPDAPDFWYFLLEDIKTGKCYNSLWDKKRYGVKATAQKAMEQKIEEGIA